jgi:hypothetical protein
MFFSLLSVKAGRTARCRVHALRNIVGIQLLSACTLHLAVLPALTLKREKNI